MTSRKKQNPPGPAGLSELYGKVGTESLGHTTGGRQDGGAQ